VTFREGETGVFDCAVYRQNAAVATAQLTVHQPDDLDAILANQGVQLKR
jgi:hypothetical protein